MNLGDRIKLYEGRETKNVLMPLLPVIIRLDGKSFHNFTRGLERPYSAGLSNLMIETTKLLVDETNANCGYTQSDEITLGFYNPEMKKQIYFAGKIFKICSILASKCTLFFNNNIEKFLPKGYREKNPVFDCRVFNVPTLEDAKDAFLWREIDAIKNSITMAALAKFSTKQIYGKKSHEKIKMLKEVGVNWHDYADQFKRGTYIQKFHKERKFTTEEIELLPLKHEARSNPDITVKRTDFRVLDMPFLKEIKNPIEVIFFGAEPEVKK
jgi:tRNA(His) 5'-end guanylyltransferase